MADLITTIKLAEANLHDIEFTHKGFGAWSISKLKVFQQCPLNFYLKYVLKVKGKGFEPSLVTDVGRAAHKILELIISGKSIGDSFAAAKREYVPHSMPLEDWDNNVARLEYNITGFRERLDTFETKHGVKRYVQEIRVGLTEDLQPTGFFSDDVYFRGILDFGIQINSGDVIILDHKTGAPAVMGVRNFKTQLDTYKVLFHHGIEKVEGAQSGIHFIKDGEIILDDYTPKKEIEGRLVNELQFYIQGCVDKTVNLGYFKHFRGPYCKWCEYNKECSEGKLLETEQKTVRFFKKE